MNDQTPAEAVAALMATVREYATETQDDAFDRAAMARLDKAYAAVRAAVRQVRLAEYSHAGWPHEYMKFGGIHAPDCRACKRIAEIEREDAG